MAEVHVLAFVQTERLEGRTVFQRRENKMAFYWLEDALKAAEEQCSRMLDNYKEAGYAIARDGETIFTYFGRGDNKIVGIWNFYVDTMQIL